MNVVHPYLWGDADVSFPDWSGTVQLDQRRTGPNLAEVIGLDPDAWMIVGLDIGGGEHNHDHTLHVIAVRRESLPDEEGDVFPRLAQANDGEIPAVDILVHDVDPYTVLKAVMHDFELHMRTRGTRQYPIRIVELSDSYPNKQ